MTSETRGRDYPYEPCPNRTEFQRDRDKRVGAKQEMLSGEDLNYNYSLLEKSVKGQQKVSYSFRGREGRQTFVLVPFQTDAVLSATLRCGDKTIGSAKRESDGNYYLLAFGDKEQEMRTYRVDRMRDIRLTSQPREGAEAFRAIDLTSYTQRVFSMYSGKQESVTIRFINPLLDTVIDRFGTSGVKYYKADDKHFNVLVNVEISDQFFGWICGFGNKAKIIDPLKVKEQFAEYIEKIKKLY